MTEDDNTLAKKSSCRLCVKARNCLNGLWCEHYREYVEHQEIMNCDELDKGTKESLQSGVHEGAPQEIQAERP